MKQNRRITCLAISLILCTLFLGNSLSPAQATAPESSSQSIAETPPFSVRTGWGLITWDETWQGTIHLKGDVVVDTGFSLTIRPGTTIILDAAPDPNKETWENGRYDLQVMGNLYASGTPLRPITFRNAEEPYYPINLYTRVSGSAVLKYVETDGFEAGQNSTIFSSTFHGWVALARSTFCSNTATEGMYGGGFILNNTFNGVFPLKTVYSYPSHIAGNTFNISNGDYGLFIGLDNCFVNDGSPHNPDQCRVMV
ncbi:MAG: hypothetical protein KKD28_07925, partial [Chloroflexi bacterium]|nr:hypothetical protein [Chloroflexota bacterium]MBU1661386.1 hypothetical protein [Chloroflexota bacterium]